MTDAMNFLDEVEEPVDILNEHCEISDFPQTLVTEKIIFVIDLLSLLRDSENGPNIHDILNVYKSYFALKKKICVKPPEFECIVYSYNRIIHSSINNAKDINAAFLIINKVNCDEDKQPLKIDEVFDKIATLVEIPDPECSKKCLPPNWVYHVVWLFGRNLHVPTMQNTNSFDFLMMTPYFALDMLYLYDNTLESNQCEQIAQCLSGLNENGKGYFLAVNSLNTEKLVPSFAQFLGHPLIRVPQERAKFNIHEMSNQLEVTKNNNDEK